MLEQEREDREKVQQQIDYLLAGQPNAFNMTVDVMAQQIANKLAMQG